MIIDYSDATSPLDVAADLCIVGAGAAGLAIARRFIGTTLRICIVESGGLEPDDETQALYEGTSAGHPEFDPAVSRLRAFGGTCNLWGGGCIPIGSLSGRDWLPVGDWPLSHADLAPWYTQAGEACDLANHGFSHESFLTPPAMQPIAFDGDEVVNRTFACSPVVFGQAWRDELARAPNVTVLLHANLLELEPATGSGTVRRARIASLHGRRGTVDARAYVLACGGIENARLLLLSDAAAPSGLGNQHDQVGRHFMDHPSGRLGTLHAADPDLLALPYDRDLHKGPGSVHPEVCLSAAAQRRHGVLAARVRMFGVEGAVPAGIQALRALKALRRVAARQRDATTRLQERVCARRNGEPVDGGRQPPTGESHARLLLKLAMHPGDIVRAHLRRRRGRPTVASTRIDLVGYFEQLPNPTSRVRLANTLDALGQRQVHVEWRLTAIDLRTYRIAAAAFGKALAKACGGRFEPAGWIAEHDAAPEVFGTSHHMGTTRMADDARHGVVDRDCRVHGVDNLYIAGSSVFPSGGWEFPTFTIIALSLRLAEHLRERLQGTSLQLAGRVEALAPLCEMLGG